MYKRLLFAKRDKIGPTKSSLQPLEQVVLTDQVSRTLFDQYAQHRQTEENERETGWLLLGYREVNEARVLAVLPAGAERDAGVGHIRFNSTVQALACRLLRQNDRRLSVLGVIHTHPGSLRHPSEGDLKGDRLWVEQLRGKEGVFAIGTADADNSANSKVFPHPRRNIQCLGELRLSWYALTAGAARYRPLPLTLTLGPDLARPLEKVWPTLEFHAPRLERLVQQLKGQLELVEMGTALQFSVPIAGSTSVLRILLAGEQVRYYLERGSQLLSVDPGETCVDRGVYLLLAELADSNKEQATD